MDNFGRVVLLLLLATIIVFSFLIGFQVVVPVNTSNSTLIDDSINEVLKSTGWSDPTPLNTERGLCNLYQTSNIEVQVVDSLQPIALISSIPENLQCDDGFIKALSKQSRVCQLEECIGSDGRLYNQNQVEELYIGCKNFQLCQNGRSGVIFGFKVNAQGKLDNESANCMYFETVGGDSTFSSGPCFPNDILNSGVFLNVDQIPVSGGNYVRIRAPATNNCLAIINKELISEPCTNLDNEGFEWFLNNELVQLPFTQEIIEGETICIPTGDQVNFPAQLFERIDVVIPEQPTIVPGTSNCQILQEIRVHFEEVTKLLNSRLHLRSDSNGTLFIRYGSEVCLGEVYPELECPNKTAIISAFSWDTLQ